jgi:subtilase family serine protease
LSNDEDEKFQELIKNLEEDEKAHVIVCFCEGLTVRKLLMAIKYLNMTNNFIIIGTDGWADRQDVVEEVEVQAVGSISIRIHSQYMKTFDEHYLNLNPFKHDENPWFREFWEDKFHCKMPQDKITTTNATESTPDLTDSVANASFALPLKDSLQVPFCTGKCFH